MQCRSHGNMEDDAAYNVSPAVVEILESHDAKSSESAENFQRFMYELFEKNGVINDLRAYLRGHIVRVLRSSQTGEPPTCQKHFTQRLELPYQALNMLIAEYLLRMEFNYALSVFVSEVPLANMVFEFSKSLMQCSNCDTGLRFKDGDVWSILNYLGVKCDSDNASDIVEMYKGEKQSPLLLCILKCITLYKDPCTVHEESSQESLSSEILSCDDLNDKDKTHTGKCKHYKFCKTCQSKITRIKKKYTKKKKILTKNIIESNMNEQNVESLMKNIDVMERKLIDEMFQQLKSVYEAEIDQMKNDEEKRVKRSLLSHATNLQKKRAEMEETFKAREAELERNVQQKKRFLWGLARALREQHEHMTRAMHDVRLETSRLSAKEDSLKNQLAEAEEVLRQRGEDMRLQISNELVILEEHLDSMKMERDNINKERAELERIKRLCDSSAETSNVQTKNDDIRTHYDLLKTELLILKKYLESAKLEPKCVMERSTITELADVTTKIDVVLNNGQDVERCRSDDRLKPNQVLNDLKKRKNVNFDQVNVDQLYRTRSRSSASSEGGEGQLEVRDSLQRLREENERLRAFSEQQRLHIEELSVRQARLQAELCAGAARAAPGARTAAPALQPQRPRTAPPAMDFNVFMQRLNSTASSNNLSHGWRKGAGEELSFFANAQPRIVVPGDTLPFIGVIRDRHIDSRRYLINQWRSLRRRTSPVHVGKPRSAAETTHDTTRERPDSSGPSAESPLEDVCNNTENKKSVDVQYQTTREQYDGRPRTAEEAVKSLERSPKTISMLATKEITKTEQNEKRPRTAEAKVKNLERSPKTTSIIAKEITKTKDYKTRHPSRDDTKSPSSVLRDAKLRLRKLEIEAEAVEQSYLDFRRKREALKGETKNMPPNACKITDKDFKLSTRNLKIDRTSPTRCIFQNNAPQTPAKSSFGKYIDEYRTKYNISETHFKNQNATSISVKPIPAGFTACDTAQKIQNYLETPIAEFRTYYHSEKRVASERRFQDPHLNQLELNNPNSPIIKRQDDNEIRNVPPVTQCPLVKNLSSVSLENVDYSERQTFKSLSHTSNNDGKHPITESFENRVSYEKSDSSKLSMNTGKHDDRNRPEIKAENPNYNESRNSSRPETSLNYEAVDIKSHLKSPRENNRINPEITSSPKTAKVTNNETVNDKNCQITPLSDSQNVDYNKTEVKRKETFLLTKYDKELEMLKQNFCKMYNLSDKSFDEELKKSFEEKFNGTKLKDDGTKHVTVEAAARTSNSEAGGPSESKELKDGKNLLRIEFDSTSAMNDVNITESQTQDLLRVVESSINTDNTENVQSVIEFDKNKFSTNMTILVGPKRIEDEDEMAEHTQNRINDSGEHAGNLSEQQSSIYQDDPNDALSSIQMQLQLSKDVLENTISELEANEEPDYPDDFSGDVDNFEMEHSRSPISMPKTSDDENFWDP